MWYYGIHYLSNVRLEIFFANDNTQPVSFDESIVQHVIGMWFDIDSNSKIFISIAMTTFITKTAFF